MPNNLGNVGETPANLFPNSIPVPIVDSEKVSPRISRSCVSAKNSNLCDRLVRRRARMKLRADEGSVYNARRRIRSFSGMNVAPCETIPTDHAARGIARRLSTQSLTTVPGRMKIACCFPRARHARCAILTFDGGTRGRSFKRLRCGETRWRS